MPVRKYGKCMICGRNAKLSHEICKACFRRMLLARSKSTAKLRVIMKYNSRKTDKLPGFI